MLLNREEELRPPPLPRTNRAPFTAVRSNLSLPICQGALEEGIDRYLLCHIVILSLTEVICIKEWISLKLYQNMSPDFGIGEQSNCGFKGCEDPVRVID